ncbi:MAG: prolyl oligopeptidase family serine peptidase, partial [Brevundimonas sp.]
REPSRTIIDTRGGAAWPETPPPARVLMLLDAANGETRALAEGAISDFSVSPDGTVAAVIMGDGPAPPHPDEVVPLEGGERQRLVLVGLDDGRRVRPLEGHDIAPNLLRWSQDSSAVLAWARRDASRWEEGQLFGAGLDGATSWEMGPLTPGTSAEIVDGVRADWLGQSPVVYAREAGSARRDWRLLEPSSGPDNLTAGLRAPPDRLAAAGDGALQVFADGAAWAMTRDGLRRLTPEDMSVREAVAGDAEQVRRLKVNAAPRRNWSVGITDQGRAWMIDAQGARAVGGASSAPRVLAVSEEAVLVLERTGLEETMRLRSASGDHSVDAVNTGLRDVVLSEPFPVDHRDVDGGETRSWLYLPPGVPAEDVRGVIIRVYPGAQDRFVWWDPLTLTYGVRSTVLAAAGFAVLSPSIPGNLPPGQRGDIYVQAVDLAVDATLEAHPGLPADRLAIFGHSFGGHAALEIATRSSRYRTYVASAAYTDLIGYWGELSPVTRVQPEEGLQIRHAQGWTEAGQGAMGGPPWWDPGAYLASSPYLEAAGVTAPVLLLAADMDFVPSSQAERMFSALSRQGRTARLVTYLGEHHHLWSPANILDRYQQILDWLDAVFEGGDPLSDPGPAGAPRSGPSSRTPPPP